MEMTKMKETAPQQKKKDKIENFFWAKSIWLVANIVLLLAVFTGFCSVRGKTINVLSFIDGLFDIFSLKGVMWYYYLSNFAHSILYLVISIKCALRFKDMLAYWNYQKKELKTDGMQETAQAVFYNCIVYFFLAGMLEETKLTGFALFACVFAMVAFVAGKVFLELGKDKNASLIYLIKTGAYFLVEGVILFILGGILARPAISGIVEGLDILFFYVDFSSKAGFYTVYKMLAFEIMSIVLLLFYLWLVGSALREYEAEKIYNRKKFMTVTLVVLIIDVLFYIVFIARGASGEAIDMIKDWFLITSTGLLPITLLAVAENMVSDFPEFAKHKKEIAPPETVANK